MTDRQTDKETDSETDRDRERERQTETEREREAERGSVAFCVSRLSFRRENEKAGKQALKGDSFLPSSWLFPFFSDSVGGRLLLSRADVYPQ